MTKDLPLEALLAEYDGNHVDTLERIRDAFSPEEAPLTEAVDLSASSDAALAAGATWLLRAWLEAGASLSQDNLDALASLLQKITDPWAQLHVCQTIGSFSIHEKQLPAFVSFLANCRVASRPFLRAWAMTGLVRLSWDHPTLEPEASDALEAAFTDPAASVRARARNVVNEGPIRP